MSDVLPTIGHAGPLHFGVHFPHTKKRSRAQSCHARLQLANRAARPTTTSKLERRLSDTRDGGRCADANQQLSYEGSACSEHKYTLERIKHKLQNPVSAHTLGSKTRSQLLLSICDPDVSSLVHCVVVAAIVSRSSSVVMCEWPDNLCDNSSDLNAEADKLKSTRPIAS